MTSLPIILAHGICPFHRLLPFASCRDNAADDRFHYFRKIRSTLIARGLTAFHVGVGWSSSLERRALDLRNGILRLTGSFTRWPQVHILAHSMGGLDARYMIYRYGMEKQVVSLTTIGTPHLGTSYADWGLRNFSFLIEFARPLGFDLSGFRDLARDECARRNLALEDFEEENTVIYRTVAGVQPASRIFKHFRFAHGIISREEGENDGLVSLRSARWKEKYFLEIMDADHLNQIGWWDSSEGSAGMGKEDFERGIREFWVRLALGLEEFE
jgi:triacylglycerol lipase